MDVKSFKGPLRKLKFYRLVAHKKKKTYNQWRILGTKHSTLVPYEKELPYFPRKKRASVIIKERPTKFKDSQLIISKKKKRFTTYFHQAKKKKIITYSCHLLCLSTSIGTTADLVHAGTISTEKFLLPTQLCNNGAKGLR